MFPDAPQAQQVVKHNATLGSQPGDSIVKSFVGETRSQLATLAGEIALRNRVIQQNDAYIYGDLLTRTLDIPVGHDMTPVNWLRRTVEIHRAQFMGRGFTLVSTFESVDVDSTDDPNAQKVLNIEQTRRKVNAERRRQIWEAIMRDNNGKALFAQLAENASAVGTSVLKCWYDENNGRYVMSPVEASEHVYAIWSRDNFREYDAIAYVYQVSKEEAARQFGVGPDVATSPLGQPLAILSTANTIEYISTQPMVTIMEVCGKIQGWKTEKGQLVRCDVGEETEMDVVIVGNEVYRLIDDPKYMPKYYIFPNKLVRRRPWGQPDITQAAVNINQTFIEALSDWRTVSSKVNFPKFKYLNFGLGTQLPAPKARKTEGIPLSAGQDIQPLEMPNSGSLAQRDFPQQLAELQQQFVREVGISRVLFDDPDMDINSKAGVASAMKSLGDITATKQALWGPVIARIATEALQVLSYFDDSIKDLYDENSGWHFTLRWPSQANKEDPVYQTMLLNRFNSGTLSIQSYLEHMGETKEELDRLAAEMSTPLTAAIHGRMLGLLAEYKIAGPPSSMPPKVNVNLRGDLNPNEVADLAAQRTIVTDQSPFPDVLGPQGNEGLTANDNAINQGTGTMIKPNQKDRATYRNAQGNAIPAMQQQQGNPELINPGGIQGPMSQPGSGATMTSAQGMANKKRQRNGG